MDALAVVDFIDTSIENASPLWYDVADGVVRIHLIYDHERASPNRAAGHVHFLLNARPGAKLTLEFLNLDNVWNGQPGSVAGELKTMALSEDGHVWRTVPTENLPGNRVQLHIEMRGPKLYVARMEPYRLSDLTRLLDSIRSHPLGTDHTDRKDGSGSRPRDRQDRQSCGAVPGIRPRSRASVGIGQQLGRRGADPAAAARRRGCEAISASLQPQRAADGQQGRRGARWDAVQPARPRSQPQLGQAGRSRAVAGERGARAVARRRDRRQSQAASRAGAAQRRQRPAARQPSTGSAARSSSRPHGHLRGAAAQQDVVHRRVDQCHVPQQRHARRRLARALRHRRRSPRVQLQLDRRAEGGTRRAGTGRTTAPTSRRSFTITSIG